MPLLESIIMEFYKKIAFFIVTLSAIAVFSAGCQNHQLQNCQLENLKLQETVDQQQQQVKQLSAQQEGFGQVIMQIATESDNLQKQLTEAKNELESLKRLKKMQEMSPETKAKMIESLEELKKIRQINAERLKEQTQENK